MAPPATRRPMRVPAREQDAVRDHVNFYFDQHDLVAEHSGRQGFRYAIFRPQIVLGNAIGSAMNPVATLGVYAVLMRELGRPLSYLGNPNLVNGCVDSRLVASAIEWSWNEPKAHGEAFNVANGDVVVWANIFDRLAKYFEMPLGEPSSLRPAEEMPKHADLWRKIAEREGLRVPDVDAMIGLSWQYAELTWAALRPGLYRRLFPPSSCGEFGFGECIDSEECIIQHLDAMRAERYLPKH